jgi:mannose-6-phosphate isomerase-like protein (cupin superfamily)
MDELRKALDIGLHGKEAEQALSAFFDQMRQWDVAIPHVEPLVLDFGLGDYQNTGLIEFWIANEIDAGYCGKYLFVFDGQTCPNHHHREKIETFYIMKGQLKVSYDDSVFIMSPGDVLRVDSGKFHSFTGIGPALLLEISMPCVVDDNYFENPDIPIGGNYKGKVL